MTDKKNKYGITLIELLIVMAILSIIATIGFIAYGNQQKRARDAIRRTDLKEIQTALQLYYQNNNSYPGGGGVLHLSTSSPPWIPGLEPKYISKLPGDPGGTKFYVYQPDFGGSVYCLGTILEKPSGVVSECNINFPGFGVCGPFGEPCAGVDITNYRKASVP